MDLVVAVGEDDSVAALRLGAQQRFVGDLDDLPESEICCRGREPETHRERRDQATALSVGEPSPDPVDDRVRIGRGAIGQHDDEFYS
jgi:hypothetical protein